MAQINFTPILLYASSTPTNVPSAGNLTNSATGSEIAINIADKNLFFKDSGGVVNTVPIRQSNTSSNGWLSATDWNTFNSKAPATSGTSILYGNGVGGFSNVIIGSGVTFAGGTLSATGSGGTVTSVSGTGTVNGLTLTGTVTSSGSLTLGGTLNLSSPPAIGGTTPAAITGTTITANTQFVSENYYAQSILGGNLRTSGGTSLLNWDGGGSGNVTINGGLLANPVNKNVSIAPTGTGTATINPATAGTMNNMVIGGTTPLAITGTTITATTFSGSGASLTSIPNSALVNSTISGVALGGNLYSLTAGTGVSFSAGTTYNGSAAITINATGSGGTVTSVAALTLGTTGTDLSSTVANSTTTPVITLNVPTASATNRGALSSTDWSIFNGKQAALVSGTNIKTVGGVSLLGSGDVGVIGATYGGTGVNNGSNTITLAGSLTHAGAFTQSFTATANTAVTLPAGATAASNNLLSSATAVGIVTGTPSSTTYLRGDGTWATIGGGGTVTSVAQSFTGGLISVSGSPITSSGTLALTVAGTSGGIPYFSSASTWASSAALTQYGVVYGGGAGAAPVATAAGSANQVLVANGAAAPNWVTQLVSANMPTGTVVQVVQGAYATQVTNSASPGTYADTGLTATITPKSASNKILAIFSLNGCQITGSVYSGFNSIYLRGASLLGGAENKSYFNAGNSLATNNGGSVTFVILDSPATTSATTYKAQIAVQSGGAGSVVAQLYGATSTLTLIEVVG